MFAGEKIDKIDIFKKYENNQIIRPLLQLIPDGIGSGIDSNNEICP